MPGTQALAVLALVAVSCLPGCGRGSRTPEKYPSPSGKRTLVVTVNTDREPRTRYLCLIVTVIDAEGKVLLREQTGASDLMRWSFRWEDDDTFVMDSSDIGTYRWTETDGRWDRFPRRAKAEDAPPPASP